MKERVKSFSSNEFIEVDIKDVNPDGNYIYFPGFCDVHVHLREPGFSYKETIHTGTLAAARGGYTDICPMPNLNPVPDSLEHLEKELEIIEKDAVINVHPYGALTVNEKGVEIADLFSMKDKVVAFSDDGKGVQDREMMKRAMSLSKELNKVVAAHCEVEELLQGGYIHDGIYAKMYNHRGICSKSEWLEVQRDIELAKETGCKFHVCHVSCKESIALIRGAKRHGVDVTCETAPHYLLLDENDLEEDGKFKMNPPLRSKEDKEALLEAIKDGTIDMIATDHAPHSKEEKSLGLEKSAFGIVGLEIAFPLLYTNLVLKDIITLDRLIELLTTSPRNRFGIPLNNAYTVWDLNKEVVINPDDFLSKGKSTPFTNWKVKGECVGTYINGKPVYERDAQ